MDTNNACVNCSHWHQLFIDGAVDEVTGRCDLYKEWRFRFEDCDYFTPTGEIIPSRVTVHTAEYVAAQAKISTRQIKTEARRLNKPYYKLYKERTR